MTGYQGVESNARAGLDIWIDDPVQTQAKSLASDGVIDEKAEVYQSQVAADISDVTAVPMHHPDSLYLRYGADLRNGLLMGGSMFVMQVAHPQVGAGVGEFSNFMSDPWHRLREIAKSGEAYIFRGKEAGLEEGRRLRELHRNIKGKDKNGKAYHSLNPKVYGWVHVIFLDRMITMHKLFGEPLDRRTQQELFLQWQEAGRVFGLRDKDMPRDIDDYYAYYNYMIDEVLEYNEVMDYMLSLDVTPPVKPNAYIPDLIWKALFKRVGKFYRDLAMFTLPVNYREKIAEFQPWSQEDEQRIQKWAARFKWMYYHAPQRARYNPKGYRIMKRLKVN